MKLRSLHIEDYKVFKDFDIDFLDSDDKPLYVVVLAGVNGSGKTTLFECLYRLTIFKNDFVKIVRTRKTEGLEKFDSESLFITETVKIIKGISGFKEDYHIYKKHIAYIPAGINNIADVESEFVKYWYNLVKFHNKRNDEITEALQKFIKDTFDGLELSITYSHIDEDDNIYFQNKNNEKFKINQLSTGEKTLLSKVLYLFFQDYKDKVILIDEPELSLHPSWQNKVLKIYENFAKANNCQVIIATHSPHIIASADNKYIRFLEKDQEGKISVINDIQAYGRDIEWVLEQMGVKNLRATEVLEKFIHCQKLLNDEKYDKAEICINDLEEEIGQNDKQIMNLRNSLFFERD